MTCPNGLGGKSYSAYLSEAGQRGPHGRIVTISMQNQYFKYTLEHHIFAFRILARPLQVRIKPKEVQQVTIERNLKANSAEGHRPIGKLEWPALLRKLDRLDPSYKE